MTSRSGGARGGRAGGAAIALAALVTAACGYTLVGRGSFLPENVKRIAFPTFKN